jgi:NADPH2:quinone reductase
MKAMVITGIGGPEVFALADVPRPVAGPGQLLVQVQAAGVNPIDYKLRQSGALGVGAGAVLGFDVAGVVEAVGPGVTAFAAGDKVFYSPGFGRPGAYAECNVVDASIVAKMPASLDFVQAAAVPLAGMTALGAVYTRGQVRVGQTVCVSAVNGGVGMFAVQICQAAGAYVFGTCSTRSLEFVEDLGAVDRIIV